MSSTVHGLDYPPNFLSSLPILLSRPSPHQPIRAISAAQFAQIHRRHFLNYPADSILFPFLHGLEGNNDAQNLFFASGGKHSRVKIPSYRGLIWVACEDADLTVPTEPTSDDERDDLYLDDDFSSDDGDHELDAMDVDPPPATPDASYMHPVHHRPLPISTNTDADTDALPSHDRRASTASSLSASSYSSESSVSPSMSASTSATSYNDSPISPSPPALDYCLPESSDKPHLPLPPSPTPLERPPLLTSTFHAADLLRMGPTGPEFIAARVPDGISLRNFSIQVPIYATLSDVVVYSPKGASRTAFALAEKFKLAIEAKARERKDVGHVCEDGELVAYNVFVLTATLPELLESLPHLLSRVDVSAGGKCKPEGAHTESTDARTSSEEKREERALRPNTIDFAQREKEEMRDLTKASEIFSTTASGDDENHPSVFARPGFLSGGSDSSTSTTHTLTEEARPSWDPTVGQIYLGNSNDVPFPTSRPPHSGDDPFDCTSNDPAQGYGYDICVECHDMAPFPSSMHLQRAEEHLSVLDSMWAERCRAEEPGSLDDDGKETPALKPRPPPNASSIIHFPFPSSPPSSVGAVNALIPFITWIKSLLQPPTHITLPSTPSTPTPQLHASHNVSKSLRTRPLKILIYSSDGYTESSILALCLLMALRRLSLPHAYLELQVVKRRSFFVYQTDLGLLKRMEARLERDRESAQHHLGADANERTSPARVGVTFGSRDGVIDRWSWSSFSSPRPSVNPISVSPVSSSYSASSSFSLGSEHPQSAIPLSSSIPSAPIVVPSHNHHRRPRASTSPLMSPFVDHQTWFDDPRFDGSFPSRVLPFLYLGNLNHASNAYMLHALGITHVVSVGECALVPPTHHGSFFDSSSSSGYQFIAGKGPGGHGSLWIEEREGRIKVLDIQGVCDDGIDTLEPQLEPICDWIEKARQEGGQILVHCRVGVSRSATVTIAYVMKHLTLPLVDAYLIVRSRRLSVLIQPNMRLLYNLCMWEIKLARERAGDNEDLLCTELARTLNWPYLAREVHTLNEKYLH